MLFALLRAREEGRPFDEAWLLATSGEVCDSFASVRTDDGGEWPHPDSIFPPELRPADPEPDGRGYRPYCGGCRYLTDGHCGLYRRPVYTGVLYTKVTHSRHEWQAAIMGTRSEWEASYEGRETAYSRVHPMLETRLGDSVHGAPLDRGTLAA